MPYSDYPHPQTGDSQDQEMVLAPSSDKQTRNYDTECSNHYPSLSILRSKGLNRSKMKYIFVYLCLLTPLLITLVFTVLFTLPSGFYIALGHYIFSVFMF